MPTRAYGWGRCIGPPCGLGFSAAGITNHLPHAIRREYKVVQREQVANPAPLGLFAFGAWKVDRVLWVTFLNRAALCSYCCTCIMAPSDRSKDIINYKPTPSFLLDPPAARQA